MRLRWTKHYDTQSHQTLLVNEWAKMFSLYTACLGNCDLMQTVSECVFIFSRASISQTYNLLAGQGWTWWSFSSTTRSKDILLKVSLVHMRGIATLSVQLVTTTVNTCPKCLFRQVASFLGTEGKRTLFWLV